jgi:two-component system chemotaxis response regulator CheB
MRQELIPKIRQFFVLPREHNEPVIPTPRLVPLRTPQPRVLAIGVSTGGPQALADLIPGIPAAFPIPILIVQHMPALFTRFLAERLQAASPLRIEEAAEGTEIVAGRVFIAPGGGHHLRVRRAGASFVTALDESPPENSCRPSVDVLFRSVAECYGGEALAVVLTGMGSDGLRGVEQLKAAGAACVVQDEATSVVWGMPGAVARAGLADAILPLGHIAAELIRRTAR